MLITRRAPRHLRRSARKRARGVTLVEILVTILVVGIGLLGLAGMQTVSMQYNHSSYLRTHANNMAYDIADRMRANRQAAMNGAYNLDLGDNPQGGGSVAANDLGEWHTAVTVGLPNGEGAVSVDSNGVATITVQWLDGRDEREDDDTTTYTLRTRI